VALLPRKAIADRWRRMVDVDVDVDGGDQESAVVQHMAAMTTHVNSFLKSLQHIWPGKTARTITQFPGR